LSPPRFIFALKASSVNEPVEVVHGKNGGERSETVEVGKCRNPADDVVGRGGSEMRCGLFGE